MAAEGDDSVGEGGRRGDLKREIIGERKAEGEEAPKGKSYWGGKDGSRGSGMPGSNPNSYFDNKDNANKIKNAANIPPAKPKELSGLAKEIQSAIEAATVLKNIEANVGIMK